MSKRNTILGHLSEGLENGKKITLNHTKHFLSIGEDLNGEAKRKNRFHQNKRKRSRRETIDMNRGEGRHWNYYSPKSAFENSSIAVKLSSEKRNKEAII